MLPILLITIIFTYFIYAAHVLDLHKSALEALCKPLAKWFGEAGNPVRAGVWAGASVVSLMAWLSPETSFLGEMRGEITGMAITVIVIDELVGYRNRLERKQEIFEQIESPVRDVAVEAIRLARRYGWLDELLAQAQLYNAQLAGANLLNVNLVGRNLFSANLQGATLGGASLRGTNLEEANLQEAILWFTDLYGANLIGANLQKARAEGANLSKANLQFANLRGIQLVDANLQRVILANANLEDANLFGANLEGADLFGASLQGAKYNKKTKWPEGFDAEAAGAIRIKFWSLE